MGDLNETNSSWATANWIYSNIDFLERLINDCTRELVKDKPDKGKVYDFLETADCLFEELWIYREHYDEEIPFFVRAYRRTLDLSLKLLFKGLVSKNRLEKICSYQSKVLKLNKEFERTTKKKVKKIKGYKTNEVAGEYLKEFNYLEEPKNYREYFNKLKDRRDRIRELSRQIRKV